MHMNDKLGKMLFAAAAAGAVFLMTATGAQAADTIEIYSSGSLRGVVAGLAAEAGPALGIEIKPSFGGAGSMRERIEKGETPDLLLSADVGSPRKLQAEGRTVVPAIAFARNRICVVSRRDAHVTPENLADRLLAKNIRLKTSQPVVDPGGDYAWSILDRIDSLHPGAGAVLKQKAQASWDFKAQPAPGQSAAAALFTSRQVDVTFTYCSGAPALLKEVPELTSFVVPPQLDPHPVEGIAVLSNRPAVLRLALYLLSEQGQAIVAKAGLTPLSGAAPPAGAAGAADGTP